jgi:WD repeat-containing protein 19
LDWDKEGELLAILQQGSGIVTLWDKNSRKSSQMDTNLKEGFSFISWSNQGPLVRLDPNNCNNNLQCKSLH